MNNEQTNMVINQELIKESYSKKIKLHITLNNNTWRNGYVKSVYADFFEFKDTENPLEAFFFIELKKVEPYINAVEKEVRER